MVKERVIVFDGEDNFIAPKTRNYDKNKGTSEFVSQVGAEKTPTSPEGDAFSRYMLLKNQEVVIPQPSEPDFCMRIQSFISGSGAGRATPDQIMTAYQLFQNNCIEKPITRPAPEKPSGIGSPLPVEGDLPPSTPPTISDVSFPNFNILGCEDLAIEISTIENVLSSTRLDALSKNVYERALVRAKSVKDAKCQPPASAPPNSSLVPIGTPAIITPIGGVGLGLPPIGGGFGGGGGGGGGGSEEETAVVPTKKSFPLIYVLLAVGALYLITRKK